MNEAKTRKTIAHAAITMGKLIAARQALSNLSEHSYLLPSEVRAALVTAVDAADSKLGDGIGALERFINE